MFSQVLRRQEQIRSAHERCLNALSGGNRLLCEEFATLSERHQPVGVTEEYSFRIGLDRVPAEVLVQIPFQLAEFIYVDGPTILSFNLTKKSTFCARKHGIEL